jgi:hypothetical protein
MHQLSWCLLVSALFSAEALIVAPTRAYRSSASTRKRDAVRATVDSKSGALVAASSDHPGTGGDNSDGHRAATSSPSHAAAASITHGTISNLRFRELKHHLHTRGAATDGTTSQLKSRLRALVFPNEECIIWEDGEEVCGPDISVRGSPDTTLLFIMAQEQGPHLFLF